MVVQWGAGGVERGETGHPVWRQQRRRWWVLELLEHRRTLLVLPPLSSSSSYHTLHSASTSPQGTALALPEQLRAAVYRTASAAGHCLTRCQRVRRHDTPILAETRTELGAQCVGLTPSRPLPSLFHAHLLLLCRPPLPFLSASPSLLPPPLSSAAEEEGAEWRGSHTAVADVRFSRRFIACYVLHRFRLLLVLSSVLLPSLSLSSSSLSLLLHSSQADRAASRVRGRHPRRCRCPAKEGHEGRRPAHRGDAEEERQSRRRVVRLEDGPHHRAPSPRPQPSAAHHTLPTSHRSHVSLVPLSPVAHPCLVAPLCVSQLRHSGRWSMLSGTRIGRRR